MNLKKIITLFLTFLLVVNISAQQKKESTLTISLRDLPLSEAIKQIEDQSKCTFFL